MEIPKIQTIFPMTNSFFSLMDYDFRVIEKEQLDILFISNYGQRSVAPLVTNIITSEVANQADIEKISEIVLKLNKHKWDKYLSIYETEYDPIHNYLDELSETITDESTTNITSNGTITDKSTNTSDSSINITDETNVTIDSTTSITDDGIINRNISNTRSNDLLESKESLDSKKLYGFNSIESVGSDEFDGDSTKTITGTVSDSGTDSKQIDTTKTINEDKSNVTDTTKKVLEDKSNISDSTRTIFDDKSNIFDSEKTRISTHKGNIGNLTTQQLLAQEIELWKWNFIESVLTDAKELLTIPMYI